MAGLRHERRGGCRILDVLAKHHCPHPGVDAGGGIRPFQHLLNGRCTGRMADGRGVSRVHLQPCWARRRVADRLRDLRGLLLLLLRGAERKAGRNPPRAFS